MRLAFSQNMHFTLAVLVLGCTLLLTPSQGLAWQELEPGLDFAEFSFLEREKAISVLRIDPSQFHFILCAASAKSEAKPLSQWAHDYALLAGINASMYLKDGITSTGYLREKEHVNNPRIHQRFGAFFVAQPKKQGIPSAAILEREDPNLQEKLAQYDLVIQNFRLIGQGGQILWPKSGPLHPIACVGQDKDGKVLFILCKIPTTAHALAEELLKLPIKLSQAMYVEGGLEAELFVRGVNTASEERYFPFLKIHPALPNVLGLRK